MSAPQFTNGPWLIHVAHRWIVPARDALKKPAEALPICQLRDPDERLTEDETLANGLLIAAAPELYEALVEADAAWADAAILIAHSDPAKQRRAKEALYAWRDKAKAALSKARGDV